MSVELQWVQAHLQSLSASFGLAFEPSQGCVGVPCALGTGISDRCAPSPCPVRVSHKHLPRSPQPVAAGSGIPQIKCYLNGVKIPHVVRLKVSGSSWDELVG